MMIYNNFNQFQYEDAGIYLSKDIFAIKMERLFISIQKWKPKFSEPGSDIVVAYQFYLAMRLIVSILCSIILVKSGLATLEIGNFESLFFMIQILTMFWSSGIAGAVTSYVSLNGNYDLVLRTAWKIMQIIGILVASLLLAYGLFQNSLLWILGGLYIVITSVLPLLETRYLMIDDARGLRLYNVWSHSGLLTLIFACGILKLDIEYYVAAYILVALVRWLYLFKLLGPFEGESSSVKAFLKYTLPICITMLIGVAMDAVDGLFVMHFFDNEGFAVYRYGGRELPFTSVIFSALSSAMIHLLISDNKSTEALKSKVMSWVNILFPIAIALMILSPYLFRLAYSETFVFSAAIFNTYLLILISRVLMPQTLLQVYHHNDSILKATFYELILNVVLSILFVQYIGMIGLALATFCAYLFQKIMMMIQLYNLQGIKLSAYIDVKRYVIFSVILIVVYIATIQPFLDLYAI